MIRNVVLHLHNELPMRADIESLPTAADAGLLCTNLRTMEGRKPLSTEFLDSVFLIPYHVIRFIEIPRASIDSAGRGPTSVAPALIPAGASDGSGSAPSIVTPPPASTEPTSTEDEELERLEPDADLLKRIREA